MVHMVPSYDNLIQYRKHSVQFSITSILSRVHVYKKWYCKRYGMTILYRIPRAFAGTSVPYTHMVNRFNKTILVTQINEKKAQSMFYTVTRSINSVSTERG